MSFKFYRVIKINYEIPMLDNPDIFLIPAYLLISIFTYYCISVHKDKKSRSTAFETRKMCLARSLGSTSEKYVIDFFPERPVGCRSVGILSSFSAFPCLFSLCVDRVSIKCRCMGKNF